MSTVDKALWVIERNSAAELSLPAVAEACVVSCSQPTFDPQTGDGGVSIWVPLAR